MIFKKYFLWFPKHIPRLNPQNCFIPLQSNRAVARKCNSNSKTILTYLVSICFSLFALFQVRHPPEPAEGPRIGRVTALQVSRGKLTFAVITVELRGLSSIDDRWRADKCLPSPRPTKRCGLFWLGLTGTTSFWFLWEFGNRCSKESQLTTIIFFGESEKWKTLTLKVNISNASIRPQSSTKSSTFFKFSIRLTTGPSGIMMGLYGGKKATPVFHSNLPRLFSELGPCAENERALTGSSLHPWRQCCHPALI